MFQGRFITAEERQKIKENKQKENEYKYYLKGAVSRMKRKDCNYKMKCYKD